MQTVTWEPGSNKELDNLFDDLRESHYSNKSQRLWQNYSKESFNFSVAFTICFADNGIPELCSTIAIRNCWPKNTFRILNRLWKHSNIIPYPKVMSPSFAETAKSQIEWLNNNTDWRLYFISRQSENWEDWVVKNFKNYNLNFKKSSYKYLTCPNECDDTCWQKIIYVGDDMVLEEWNKK